MYSFMLRGFSLYLAGCLVCICVLRAQMVPNDPVLDFRLPRFSEDGYAQWILRGGQGIYDSEEQIRVKEMSLSIYSGDERKALEMKIDSPEATLLVKENRAISDSSIEIVGSNFKVSGVGWMWDGTKKEIEVKSDVAVEFSQEVAGMLSGRAPEETGESSLTEIFSRSLLLKTTPEAYRFQFTDSVKVVSNDTELNSELLVAIADIPESEDPEDTSMAELEFDSIDKIIATDQVVIAQAGNVLKAEEAEFSLREQSAEFRGNPSIKTSGAYVSGGLIRSREGVLIVDSSEESGRAQMIVSQAGGLGVAKGISPSQETVVLADTISMQEFETENQFNFEGSVEVTSGSMRVRTDNLTLYLDPTIGSEASNAASDTSGENAEDEFRLGEVVRVTGEGSVYIEQENQVVTCDKAVFYPKEEHAVLYGSPKVESEQAIITGDTMELQQGMAVVNGSADHLVKVILPKLPDLGAEDLEFTKEAQTSESKEANPEEAAIAKSETIVRAETLLMTEHTNHYLINFKDSVSVEGTNLKAVCNRMDVILIDQQDDSDDDEQVQVRTIRAYENIVFEQNGRKATADKATIKPLEGEVVLEGNAVLTDDQGKVSGHRITMHKGKGRATVEGDGSKGSRARITLPEMEFLKGFPGEENDL